jgi:hypothetical protein
MNELKYFLTQAKRKNGTFEKGCAVHDTKDNGQQAFHAYLSAYAYGHETGTDYVFVALHDSNGAVVEAPKVWDAYAEG